MLAPVGVPAQDQPALRLHRVLEGPDKPVLCRDREDAALLFELASRSVQARERGENDKSARLLDVVSRLESELCTKPNADDLVTLRCRADRKPLKGAEVSLVKVSAFLRTEVLKGEQPFFSWTAKPVTDARADNPEARAADARWCGGGEREDDPLAGSPDQVLRVQQKLFDLGVNIRDVTGQMTPETIQLISAVQKSAGLPVTGQLTRRTAEAVEAIPIPRGWAALAFDGRGTFGLVDAAATRRAAEAEAVAKLRRKSGRSYKVDSVPAPRCIALATTRYRTPTGGRRISQWTQAFTSRAETVGAARQNAFDFCNREKGGGRCKVELEVCAELAGGPEQKGAPATPSRVEPTPSAKDTRPPRFDPKSLPVNAPMPGLKFDFDERSEKPAQDPK